MSDEAAFDAYAHGYDEALAQGLAVTGEGRDYYARGRVGFLARCLRATGTRARRVIDFGCGTGATAPFLLQDLAPESLLGLDVSQESVDVARGGHAGGGASFATFSEYAPAGDADVVYTNGVFHHIPPAERAGAVDFIWRCLRPGGHFALWDNNPWNPGTRYVMSRIPFDRDAVVLSAGEAGRLVRARGFEVVRTDFLFLFPSALRWLRPLELPLSRLPLGGQYQVLCRRRADSRRD